MRRRTAVFGLVALLVAALGVGLADAASLRRNAPVPKENKLDPSKVLELALDAAEKIESPAIQPWLKDHTLTYIASEFGRCGNVERARQLFRTITIDEPGPGNNVSSVVRFMASSGLADSAVELAKGHEEWLDPESFQHTGRTDLLATVVAAVNGTGRKDQFRTVLASELIRLGKLDAAEKVIAEMGDGHDRGKLDAVTRLAVARHKASQPARAIKLLASATDITARLMETDNQHGYPSIHCRLLATAQAECGDFAAASGTLKRYETACEVKYTVPHVALIRYRSGDRKVALEEMARVTEPEAREWCHLEMTKWHIGKREWKEAEAVADRMRVIPFKVKAYLALASARVRTGDRDHAKQYLKTAEVIAGPEGKNAEYPTWKVLAPCPKQKAWEAIIRARVRLGGGAALVAESQKINDPYPRAVALLNVARGLRSPCWDEE